MIFTLSLLEQPSHNPSSFIQLLTNKDALAAKSSLKSKWPRILNMPLSAVWCDIGNGAFDFAPVNPKLPYLIASARKKIYI